MRSYLEDIHVKRLVVGGAILALGVAGAGISQAGTSTGQGAQKSGLYPTTTMSMKQCDSAKEAQPADALSGFVILNGAGKTGSIKKIVGEVSLKAGAPDTTYTVFLVQDGTNDCQLTGTLTTNSNGNGNSHIDTSKMETSGMYYVVLRDPNEMFASRPVPIA